MRGIFADDKAWRNTLTVVFEGTRMRLKAELKRRRIGEVEFAKRAGVSHTWLRKIIAGEHAGPGARAKIREALSYCTVCPCRIEVPPDEVLFATAGRKRRAKAKV